MSFAASATSSVSASDGGQLTPRTRLACYPAQFSAFKPRLLKLADQFGVKQTLSIDFPDTVCAPTPGKSTGYVTCYHTTLKATNTPSAVVRGSDDLGAINTRVDVKGLLFCVPAARIDNAPGSPAKDLDSFACYPSLGPQLGRMGVTVTDDFGSGSETISTRSTLCAPAAIGSTRLIDRHLGLSCYGVGSNVKGTSVLMRDQFGLLKAALGARTRVCAALTLAPY
jgi:hypothetical protein